MVASGIRVGTPAVTSRGMGEPEMDAIAEYIARTWLSGGRRGAGNGAVGSRVPVPQVPLYPEA